MNVPKCFRCKHGALEKRAVTLFRATVFPCLGSRTDRILYGTPTAVSRDTKTGLLNASCLHIAALIRQGNMRIIVGNKFSKRKAELKVKQWKEFGYRATSRPVDPANFGILLTSLKRGTDIVFMMSGETAGFREVYELCGYSDTHVFVMVWNQFYHDLEWEHWHNRKQVFDYNQLVRKAIK